jgi:hypothetical protein
MRGLYTEEKSIKFQQFLWGNDGIVCLGRGIHLLENLLGQCFCNSVGYC